MKDLDSVTKLIEAFQLFPSIGAKTAERMAYSLLEMNEKQIQSLLDSIKNANENVHFCKKCGMLIDSDTCPICDNNYRNHKLCLVVENAKDALRFEKTDSFNGIYHCLGGLISLSKGIEPISLRISELKQRITDENIEEIIIATNSTIEGETTAIYITNYLKDLDIKISRLAFGVPVNGKFDYADSLTLTKSITGRVSLKEKGE